MNEWSPVAREVYDPLKAGSIDATDNEPHDNGIVRAMQAKYKPNKDVVGDPEKTLFLARLNPKTDEQTIEQKFSKYGSIKRFRLIRDIITGFSRCYGFVEYSDHNAAELAWRKAYKLEIDGCEIFVDYECERKLKGWIPRRFGGGFGGKKESGQLRFGGRDRPFRKPIINPLMNMKQNYDRDLDSQIYNNEMQEHNMDKKSGYDRYKSREHEKLERSSDRESRSIRRDRSGERSLDRENDRRKDKNIDRSREDRKKERIKDDRKRDKSKDDRKRDKSKDDRKRDRSKDKLRRRSQDRIRDRSRDRNRNRSRDRNRDRSRDRTRDRSRDRTRDRRKRDTDREKDSRSKDISVDKNIDVILDADTSGSQWHNKDIADVNDSNVKIKQEVIT